LSGENPSTPLRQEVNPRVTYPYVRGWNVCLGELATNTQAGEGFGPGSLVQTGPVEVKRARLVFSTRGRSGNPQGDVSDGGTCLKGQRELAGW
jgi:hypothetical protein